MNTEILFPAQDHTAIKRAAAFIQAGEVVGMPTETVYGLAANALSEDAVRKIFAAKGRPQDNPLIVHIADIEQLCEVASAVPPSAQALANAYWPGPLTIILPRSERIPLTVTAGLETVGIRLPSHPVARDFIRACGVPLAAPSANTSGRPSTTTAQHVYEDLYGKIPAILDGGPSVVGVESTIVSLAGDKPRLLRPGGISLEQLEAILGPVEVDRAVREKIADDVRVSAPGMKYRHYAPKAPVTVVCGNPDASAAYIRAQAGDAAGVLVFTEFTSLFSGNNIRDMGSKDDPVEQAQRIFDALRSFDRTDVTVIYTQCPAENGVGLAVANRLKKAAGFHVIDVDKELMK